MGDVKLYELEKETAKYEEYVNRWAYAAGAYDAEIKFAKKYLKSNYETVIADFCCGPAQIPKRVSKELGGIKKVYLVDINKNFLEIAKKNLDAKEVIPVLGDIVNVKLPKEVADCVISSFAYHHVTNEDKPKFIKQAKTLLKKGGIILLSENYLTDSKDFYKFAEEEVVSSYGYEKGMINFMRDIAKSSNTEFKVPKRYAVKQFKESGFELIEDEKIWPLDNRLPKEEGTFVQVWRKV